MLMKRLAVLPAIALAGAMALPSAPAHAWDRGSAIAAGAIGGIAAGALIGAAASNTYAYPAYGYGYGYGYAPARAYGYAPAYAYEPAYEEPVVRRRVVYRDSYRVVRRAPVAAYQPAPYRWGPTVQVGYGYGSYGGWGGHGYRAYYDDRYNGW
jgi:hypothetical protein